MMMCAFLFDTGIFKKDFDIDEHVASFPSDWTLIRLTFQQAARDTMFMGENLSAKRIYMSSL